jgi:hypothetical protein
MSYEYKTVGAPEKGKRKRGVRSQSERVAIAFDEILQAEATDGWEYLRTDLLPVMENAGWFRRGHEVHRAVMVFRRSLDTAKVEEEMILHRAPSVVPPRPAANTPARSAPVEPTVPMRPPAAEPAEDPDLRIAELVRGRVSPKPGG